MTRVIQSRFTEIALPDGGSALIGTDCLLACMASLLGLTQQEADAERIIEEPDWIEGAADWLASRGKAIAVFALRDAIPIRISGAFIGIGPSPRSRKMHAVLCEASGSGEIEVIHDPSPSREGVEAVEIVVVIFDANDKDHGHLPAKGDNE